ncbi:MAG: TIGR00730 family Rossman fold protein [Bacteroidota bacterium]|nr:TIGR00730 family Rossman fold protein [Bacteroidota bacterium]
MKKIAIYCGSSAGPNEIYRTQAAQLGRYLAENNIHVVFGGGKVGMMGILADAALEAGGEVTGVIPGFLHVKEVAHNGLTELITVETMHARKALIEKMCDGAIALPGGFGTLDELFEMLTWGQLGLHDKPVGILNTNGFYNQILSAVDRMVEDGFLKDLNRDMLLVSEHIDELFKRMQSYAPPRVRKWIMDGDPNNIIPFKGAQPST